MCFLVDIDNLPDTMISSRRSRVLQQLESPSDFVWASYF